MARAKVEDFEIESTAGTFRLSDQLGHPVVLYFYPRDNTPGCTTEGMAFRDLCRTPTRRCASGST